MSVLCSRCSTVLFLAAFLAALSVPPVVAQPAGAVSELTDLRTPTAKVWLNANGTTTAEMVSGPVYYQETDGAWRDIDTTLVPTDSGYSVAKNVFRARLAPDAAGWHAMDLEGVSLAFKADAPNSSVGTADGNTITYSDAWPGVDLRYRVLPTSIKEELILQRPPTTSVFRFVVRPTGLQSAPTADGGIDFGDAAGRPVIHALAPFMYDSKGRHSWSIKSTITADRDGSLIVSVRPDPAWLTKATYPVVIDPSNTVLYPSVDEHAMQGLEAGGPCTWEPAWWPGSCSPMNLSREEGGDPELPGLGWYPFVKFDTSGISTSAVVITADVQLTNAGSADPDRSVSMRRALGSWPCYSLPSLGSVLASCTWTSGAHTFAATAVTSMVADWIHTPSSNYGVEFQGPTSGFYTMSCYGSGSGQTNSPKLTVGYVVDSTPPDPPVVTRGSEYTNVNTELHASWTCSDEQSGIKEYKYAVGTTAGATNIKYWTSTGIATWPNNSTGTSASPTFSPPLLDATYYFTVMAWNWAGLPSAQGNSDGITVDTVAPSFSNIVPMPTWGSLGAPVTVTFTASETLSGNPSVQVNGNDADFVALTGADYTYVYEIEDTDPPGAAAITVSGTDLAGNSGNGGAPTALQVYCVPDGAPDVVDDGEETVDTTLHAVWYEPETEFPIDEYRYAVGTTPGGTQVQYWTTAGTDTEVTTDPLNLAVGTTYFVSVKGRTGGDWTPVGPSNGITYVDFMLNVLCPTPDDVFPDGWTLPQSWDDGSKSEDVHGSVGVRTGTISGAAVTVNGESMQVTVVDDRHATWSNANSANPVSVQGAEWQAMAVVATSGALSKTKTFRYSGATVTYRVDFDQGFDHLHYVSPGTFVTWWGGAARYIQVSYLDLQTAKRNKNTIILGIVQNERSEPGEPPAWSGRFDYTLANGSPPPEWRAYWLETWLEPLPPPAPPPSLPLIDSSGAVFYEPGVSSHRGAPGADTNLRLSDSPMCGGAAYRWMDGLIAPDQHDQWIGDNASMSGPTYLRVSPATGERGVHDRLSDWLVLAIDENGRQDPGEDERTWTFRPITGLNAQNPALKRWHVRYQSGTYPFPPHDAYLEWFGQLCSLVGDTAKAPPRTNGPTANDVSHAHWVRQ